MAEENTETEEQAKEESNYEEKEIEEERARIDENTRDDTHHMQEAIEELMAEVKSLKIAVNSFADMGGVIRETTDIDDTQNNNLGGFEDSAEVEIDEDVIRNIDNIVFDD